MEIIPPGLPDHLFLRGKVPMTKSEVRAISIAKARLRPTHRVLDIGAGTGSFTIESALLCPQGQVVAVERNPEALELLRQNIAHFALSNIEVRSGEAPDILHGLAPFDRIFLGGSGGRLGEILALLPSLLTQDGRLVANAICLESTMQIWDVMKQAPWQEPEIVQISVARGVPVGESLTRFEAMSPVWICSAGVGVSTI